MKKSRMNRVSNLCGDCHEEFYCDYICSSCGIPICGCTGDRDCCGECREEALEQEWEKDTF